MPAPKTICSAMSTAAGWPSTRSRPTAPPTARSGRSYDRAEEQVRDLITGAAGGDIGRAATSGTDEQRIGDLYASFMDEPTVAERGVQPLLDELATIDAADDPDALAAVLGALQRTGVGGGAGAYVDTDSKDSTPLPAAPEPVRARTARRVLLPRRAARRDPGRLPRAHRRDVRARVRRGPQPTMPQTAARIVALETKLAAAHWDVVKRRDADLTYNLRTFADLPAEAPGFDWAGWVDRDGHDRRMRSRKSLCASPTT